MPTILLRTADTTARYAHDVEFFPYLYAFERERAHSHIASRAMKRTVQDRCRGALGPARDEAVRTIRRIAGQRVLQHGMERRHSKRDDYIHVRSRDAALEGGEARRGPYGISTYF